ncbi:hypothetical protein GWI33_000498 [Rhynchophorus ferrugineus]|uniref:Uncharacterized protein n=1 Tax=Rhynchophorus ferrugineus TaxID=354439 RepID=A0A834M3X2_RHYFE|nr:hypothetical protein GWI33_000498 [Rhynchophorus ferrugineus]
MLSFRTLPQEIQPSRIGDKDTPPIRTCRCVRLTPWAPVNFTRSVLVHVIAGRRRRGYTRSVPPSSDVSVCQRGDLHDLFWVVRRGRLPRHGGLPVPVDLFMVLIQPPLKVLGSTRSAWWSSLDGLVICLRR